MLHGASIVLQKFLEELLSRNLLLAHGMSIDGLASSLIYPGLPLPVFASLPGTAQSVVIPSLSPHDTASAEHCSAVFTFVAQRNNDSSQKILQSKWNFRLKLEMVLVSKSMVRCKIANTDFFFDLLRFYRKLAVF